MPLGPVEIPKVFHIRFPTANMPSRQVGQLNFTAEHEGFSFLMPRDDFARLGRRITQLLAAEPQDDPSPG
jgi:hypothetical protein